MGIYSGYSRPDSHMEQAPEKSRETLLSGFSLKSARSGGEGWKAICMISPASTGSTEGNHAGGIAVGVRRPVHPRDHKRLAIGCQHRGLHDELVGARLDELRSAAARFTSSICPRRPPGASGSGNFAERTHAADLALEAHRHEGLLLVERSAACPSATGRSTPRWSGYVIGSSGLSHGY